MTITYPRTDILDIDIADQTFLLVSRQELGSRSANGTTYGKDFGSALWQVSFTTGPIPNDDALAYEALLNSLDGVIGSFEAYDLRRPYPRATPDGSGASDGVLASVNTNNKAITLSGLAASQVVSRGDYLSFTYGTSRALHQVMETVTANGSGVTPEFEVRPHLRPGWTLSPAITVKLKNPAGLFSLTSGSVQPKPSGALHTVISWSGTQTFG
jgi:hypothetical protein